MAYIVGASIVVSAMCIAYYFLIFIPRQANIRLEQTVLERFNIEKEKDTKLRMQASKECDEIMTTSAQAIAETSGPTQQKIKELELFMKNWNETYEERCIQNKINVWKGE